MSSSAGREVAATSTHTCPSMKTDKDSGSRAEAAESRPTAHGTGLAAHLIIKTEPHPREVPQYRNTAAGFNLELRNNDNLVYVNNKTWIKNKKTYIHKIDTAWFHQKMHLNNLLIIIIVQPLIGEAWDIKTEPHRLRKN